MRKQIKYWRLKRLRFIKNFIMNDVMRRYTLVSFFPYVSGVHICNDNDYMAYVFTDLYDESIDLFRFSNYSHKQFLFDLVMKSYSYSLDRINAEKSWF